VLDFFNNLLGAIRGSTVPVISPPPYLCKFYSGFCLVFARSGQANAHLVTFWFFFFGLSILSLLVFQRVLYRSFFCQLVLLFPLPARVIVSSLDGVNCAFVLIGTWPLVMTDLGISFFPREQSHCGSGDEAVSGEFSAPNQSSPTT
jgi:hypothetical protein